MSTELLHKGILFDFDGTLVPNLDLADMRRICDADTRWLFLLACMLRRGLDGGGAADDSLLVWRMLAWRWGVRLPS